MTAKPLPTVHALTRPYWEAAARDELVVQRCTACGTATLYPKRWCPSCWSTELEWTPVAGTGEVIAHTTVWQTPFASYEGDVPYVVAIVRLDEGPQLMTNILGCDPDPVAVGRRVRVDFESRQDMKVPQFRLAD
jgi:hypothetical protein